MHENNLALLFGVIALLFLVWNFIIVMIIKDHLQQRGEKVNPATMHFQIFSMAKKYREFNQKEMGTSGKHYGTFWISILLFALFLLLGILFVA
ncbi:hypothetical protein [Draconibacterium sediminis]|uniref:DUF3899 domain-containing protein n=1 Tax=Draconibacterium sediminis TaxID=1544798 RepID=A0A0D8JC15_9BACT|nr:hypothetical protein [Draconibacterium sediminis]KJF44254.1 hypothetical protein LH29_01675 [Draconibacterium sediminis]